MKIKDTERLLASHADLVALAKTYAGECSECGGTGMRDSNSQCRECADIHLAINNATQVRTALERPLP